MDVKVRPLETEFAWLGIHAGEPAIAIAGAQEVALVARSA